MGVINITELELTNDQIEVYNEAMASIKKHNQAAIHLHTGGGKSYILAKILATLREKHYKTRKKKFNTLYISKAGSCNRVQQLFNNVYWEEFVNYITFTELQRDEKVIDTLGIKSIEVIVVDEAHSALAPQTYKGLEYIINKYPKATMIAMSANEQRYDHRRWIFDWLTPKLKLDVDYKDRGLKWAVQNNKICDFTYKSGDIERLKTYCDIFTKLHEQSLIFSDIDTILKEAKDIIEDYKSNVFVKLGKILKEDIVTIGADGSQGDRWFVFFNYVYELREQIDAVETMFKTAYSNYNVKINMIEYHNKVYDITEASNILNGPATPGQVDVILTCLKGGESFHPEHTRGIIMNRKSNSVINVTQMLGRPLELKELCKDKKIIYDLVGNNSTIDITQTIFNGSEHPDDRRLVALLNNLNSTSDVIDTLEKNYSGTIDIEVIDDSIEDLLDEFANIALRTGKLIEAKIIANVLNERRFEYPPNTNIFKILNDIDNKEYYKKFKLTDKLQQIQKLFIQGYFGEHLVTDPYVDDEYNRVYSLLGNYLYMTPNADVNCEYKLNDLINIAEEIKGYNYDYRNRISKTKELNKKISNLRALNLDGKLSESYQKFCKRNLIDIDGLYTNVINTVLNSDEAKKYPSIENSFKSLVRYFNKIENTISLNKLDDESLDIIIRALAKEHVFTLNYRRWDFGKQASNAIRLRYLDILKTAKKYVTKEEYELASLYIHGILRERTLESEINNTKKYCEIFGKEYELAIIRLAKNEEENNLGTYSNYVLDELNIKSYNGKRTTAIKELVDKTPFGIYYKQFIKTNSEIDYNRLQVYKVDNLPNYYKQLLRTRIFKQQKSKIEQDKLLQKENMQVKEIVSQLFYKDEDKINIIKKAVNNKSIDSRKLLIYAIPNKLYSDNKSIIDAAIVTPWNELELDKQQILDSKLDGKIFYCIDIINNLIDADLIPEEQKEFAHHLIDIA